LHFCFPLTWGYGDFTTSFTAFMLNFVNKPPTTNQHGAKTEMKDNFTSQILDPDAWNRWVTDGLEIYSVPGNHGSMTKEPNVRILASKLSDRLNHAESRRLDSLKTEKVMLKEKGYSVYHQNSQNPNQVRVFEVEDTFYDTYIRGSEETETLTNSEKMRDRGIIDCSPKPITPEQLVEFMNNENPTIQYQKNIRSLFNLLRGQDWWFYKIPPLLAIAYAEILTQDIPPHPSFTTLLALTVSMFCVAAYGHVVNDIFDIEVDEKAGKPNRMASLSRGQQTGLSFGLAVLGLIPWCWIGFNPTSGILLAVIYLLLTVYPAPPLRLKERFIFGAVADAATVHAVPTLLVATVFANLAVPSSPSNNLLAIIATAWAFAVGIRGILLHQIWDRENDLKSGIQTLATKLGVGTLRFWINSIVFPLEAILSTALVLVIAQSSPFFLVPCAAYGLMLLVMGQNELNPSPLKSLISFCTIFMRCGCL
jgi:4-hydroxybenzoate polyprenyltransferase